MSELVERVAQAIANCGAPGNWDLHPEGPIRNSWRHEARAAIESMRNLTPEMREAFQQAFIRSRGDQIGQVWNAVINEALK